MARFIATGLPGDRLPVLRRLLDETKDDRVIRILETHNGITGLIAEATSVEVGGKIVEFDGMWSSSLTASAAAGKPDIETVDTTARLALVSETLDVTSKPLIYDADTGGKPEIFRFTVRSLEKLGVSMAIIEDKAGLKQNSLFGTDRKQEVRRGSCILSRNKLLIKHAVPKRAESSLCVCSTYRQNTVAVEVYLFSLSIHPTNSSRPSTTSLRRLWPARPQSNRPIS